MASIESTGVSVKVTTMPGMMATSGYACGGCGLWVDYGGTGGGHMCPSSYSFVTTEELARLQESEHQLNEIKRILEGS